MEIDTGNWRVVASWLALMAILLGFIIANANSADGIAATSSVVFALVAMHTDFTILWVLSAGIVLILTNNFVVAAHEQSGGVVTGYVMMICGLWIPAATQCPSNVGERFKASMGSLTGLAGLLFILVALVAMILYWTEVEENSGADFLGTSFDLFLVIVLFIRSTWWTDLIWKRISLFYFSYFQVGLLAEGLSSSGTVEAAAVLAWIAVVGFIILLLVDGAVKVEIDTSGAKSPSFILTSICFVMVVVGAIIVHGDNSKSGRWIMAVSVFATFFLLLGLLCGPDTGRTLFQNTALAFCMVTIGVAMSSARAFNDSDKTGKTIAMVLVVLGMLLAFIFQASLSGSDFALALAKVKSDRLHLFALVGLVISVAGLSAWGAYSEDRGADGSSDVILIGIAFFNTAFFGAAFFLARPWLLINLFTSTLVMVLVMSEVSEFANDSEKEGDRDVGQMGTAWVWIGHVIFVLCGLAVLPRDHNRAAEEGAGLGGSSAGGTGEGGEGGTAAGPGRLSEPYSPEQEDLEEEDLEAGHGEDEEEEEE